ERTDGEPAALGLDALELGDAAEIDEIGRRGQALLHRRHQGHAAGDQLAVGCRLQRLGGVGDRGGAVGGAIVQLVPPYSAAPGRRAAWAACQTFSGVAGMSRCGMPSASVTALISAAGEAMAPASPQPLTPSGLCGHGVFVLPTLKLGRSSARGM